MKTIGTCLDQEDFSTSEVDLEEEPEEPIGVTLEDLELEEGVLEEEEVEDNWLLLVEKGFIFS